MKEKFLSKELRWQISFILTDEKQSHWYLLDWKQLQSHF